MRFRILLRFFILLISLGIYQQRAQAQYVLTEAVNAYNLYDFEAAKPLFVKAFNKKATAKAARGAAESYRLTKDYGIAETWYAQLWTVKGYTLQDELNYAAVLMNNAKYSEAVTHLNNYLLAMPNDRRAHNMLKGCDSIAYWTARPLAGRLENMEALNSPYSDWSIASTGNKFVFASDRPYKTGFAAGGYINKRYYSWTGQSYLHLYESEGIDANKIRLFNQPFVNGDYHSASASYTADGKNMFLSVTNLVKKRGRLIGKDTVYTLNIEVKQLVQDGAQHWTLAPDLPFNEILQYSVGDPWINASGDTLYFVSSQGPGQQGGTDIYYSTKNQDKWSTPVNMGPVINTEGNERTPYFDTAGHFYFASDGHPGMGGLDIFTAMPTAGHSWMVINMGVPVNTPHDDFAPAVIDHMFYLSSNRAMGKGSDDIYRFAAALPVIALVPVERAQPPVGDFDVPVLTLKSRPVVKENPDVPVSLYFLSGVLLDKEDHLPLANALIKLRDNATGTQLTTHTDTTGHYIIMLDGKKDYQLRFEKKDYTNINPVPISIRTAKLVTINQDLEREKTVYNKPFRIDNLYFDTGKSDIRLDAAKELDKLVELFRENPTWRIELSSHTDSRSSDAFNMALSQRRAAATKDYLVKHGIPASQLIAKGYGETRLLNKCANGVPCTEAEHQLNRRSEFTILK
ncbi:OmpA family protein [Chitinophaga sp. 30R24]|uniref:OmpA family protein n=1 Tax=Chitinophaga sp. 30R24 TaxID=3248838 RepID=UPI003B9090A5